MADSTETTKELCLDAGCSWCSQECRDPQAELNEECVGLIPCPTTELNEKSRECQDEQNCPENCLRVPDDLKCNDPSISGCFTKQGDTDAGHCPKAKDPCPEGEFDDKSECLVTGCVWCEGECRDPCAIYYGTCEGNIRRQVVPDMTKDNCLSGDNKWCNGQCLKASPRLLSPNEISEILKNAL